MSCCDSCESGYGCKSGLSGLYGLDGLSGLMGDLLAKGSQVRVGFEYQNMVSIAEAQQGLESPFHIQEVLAGAMLGSGEFANAFAEVKPPGWGGLQNGYITVMGTTFVDKGHPEDVGGLVQQLIQEYLPTVRITRRDRVAIDSIPQASVGKPGIQQTYDPSRTLPQQGQALPPGECKWDAMSFGEYVACQLGIESPLGGVGVGAAGALVGVGVITLLAVVLLKR